MRQHWLFLAPGDVSSLWRLLGFVRHAGFNINIIVDVELGGMVVGLLERVLWCMICILYLL
jgi:hypothetical protein